MIARKYRYLIALARERHFGRAAQACHVSPSTLSAAIRDLETELGVSLVERGQQFSGLTPEGACVLDYAQRMVASAEGLRQELASLRGGLQGHLRLGVIPTALTVAASLTQPVLRRHPRLTATVLSLNTARILARLRAFELDAGIVYVDSGGDEDLLVRSLWHETHVLLTHASDPLAARDGLTWAEAAQLPLCLLTRDMQNRKIIDAVFAGLGCPVMPTLETNSIISLLAHVGTGAWSSIVPQGVVDSIGLPPGLTMLALREPTVSWATGLVVMARQPRPPLVEALLSAATELQESMAARAGAGNDG